MKIIIRDGIDINDVNFCKDAHEEAKMLGWQSPNSFIKNYAIKFYECYTVEDTKGNKLAVFGIREDNNKTFYFSTKKLIEKRFKDKIKYIKKMVDFIENILSEDYNVLEVEIPNKDKYLKLIKLLDFKIYYENDFIKIGIKKSYKQKKIDLIINKAF